MHRLNTGIFQVLPIFNTFWLVQISTIIHSFRTQHSGVIWTAVNPSFGLLANPSFGLLAYPSFGLIGFERSYGEEHVETQIESV